MFGRMVITPGQAYSLDTFILTVICFSIYSEGDRHAEFILQVEILFSIAL